MSNVAGDSALNNDGSAQLVNKKNQQIAFLLGLLCVVALNFMKTSESINRPVPNRSLSFAPKEVSILPNQDISQCQSVRKESYSVTLGDIHSTNPYDNFAPQTYDVAGPDVVGWGIDTKVFEKVFDIVKPKFMVEGK